VQREFEKLEREKEEWAEQARREQGVRDAADRRDMARKSMLCGTFGARCEDTRCTAALPFSLVLD